MKENDKGFISEMGAEADVTVGARSARLSDGWIPASASGARASISGAELTSEVAASSDDNNSESLEIVEDVSA